MNWWKTAPESLDLYPIENMWHEFSCKVKPRSKDEGLGNSGALLMLLSVQGLA